MFERLDSTVYVAPSLAKSSNRHSWSWDTVCDGSWLTGRGKHTTMIQRLTLQIICLIRQYYHLFLYIGVRLDEPDLLAKASSTTIECLRMQPIRYTDLQRSKLMAGVNGGEL
jgi:hypothetical protein